MPATPDAGALRGSALASILPATALGGLGAVLFGEYAGLSSGYVLRAAIGLVAGAALLVIGLRAHDPHRHFGIANQLTLTRAVLVVLLAALIGEARLPAMESFTLATLAALLDAVDGRIARSRGLSSRYGARFDMETDALLIAVLSVLLWQSDRVGAWVLASGGLRYAFVLAGYALPWLRAELAPSRRRQTFAVLQVVTLLVAFAPFVPQPLAITAAVAGLAGLLYSFAIDIGASWRHGARPA
ncbi:MAG: CDP-alcohol phosphatidyltransferase family protein [Steroidobacteraceae bacterium]